jgi:hypothetical protein
VINDGHDLAKSARAGKVQAQVALERALRAESGTRIHAHPPTQNARGAVPVRGEGEWVISWRY